jgi:GT2 family glycosyltransferase
MTGNQSAFSILITTKNRKIDLVFTLNKIQYLLDRKDVVCIICDDGSIDGTASFLQTHYPNIKLIQNQKSQGLIYSRNRLLSLVTTEFAISIDDDLHFITKDPLEKIANFFEINPNVGIVAFRIFWDIVEPQSVFSSEQSHRVKSFAGGANAFRMKTWYDLSKYPEWFIFYGEEDYASYQLFKKGWEIHYLPEVLVNHRVDLKTRKNNADYSIRLRRSLRAGWYLFFLFFPLQKIPLKMAYSIWMQFKLKVFRGDIKALQAIILALFDLVIAIPKIMQNSNRLTLEEYDNYQKLLDTKIYWEPEKSR